MLGLDVWYIFCGVNSLVRIRPFLSSEIAAKDKIPIPCISVLNQDRDSSEEVTVHIKDQETSRNECYKLDSFFGEGENVGLIFQREVSPVIPEIFHGCNATVFAYGAMGSGKTYKMRGTDEHPGLMPLAMSTILSMCEIMGGLVEISYYEVYLDRCYDLLEPKAKEISVLEDKDGRVQLKGLSKVPVHSMSEFHEIFSSGIQRRKVAHTGLNNVSCRSHGVLMIVVSSCHDGSKSVVTGKLNLIDLAGDHLLETGLLLCTWAIFITLDMMVGRSFLRMMLESFTTNTTQLFQALLNKKWLRWQQLESI